MPSFMFSVMLEVLVHNSHSFTDNSPSLFCLGGMAGTAAVVGSSDTVSDYSCCPGDVGNGFSLSFFDVVDYFILNP